MKKKILLAMPLVALMMSTTNAAAQNTSSSTDPVTSTHVWDFLGDKQAIFEGLGGTGTISSKTAPINGNQQIVDNLFLGGNGDKTILQVYSLYGSLQFNPNGNPSYLTEGATEIKENDGFISFRIPAGAKGKLVARIYPANPEKGSGLTALQTTYVYRDFTGIKVARENFPQQAFYMSTFDVQGDESHASTVIVGRNKFKTQLNMYLMAWVPENGYNNKVTIDETGFTTYTPNVNVTIPEGVKAYYVSAVDATTKQITLGEIKDTIPAFNGVILTAKPGEVTLPIADNCIVMDMFKANTLTKYKNILKYSFKETTIPSDANTYFAMKKISDGTIGFAKVDAGSTIPAYQAYLAVDTKTIGETTELPFDNTVSGIKNISSDEKSDNAYYTVDGVKVEKPVKGIYIHNGKKAIIK
jgi:hypothetical protein